MTTTLEKGVVTPRTTLEHENKSNLSTPAAVGPDQHNSETPVSQIPQVLNLSDPAITKDLHSTAGMGDELAEQPQAEIPKKQNNAQENTIFDKFLEAFKFAPLLQKGIIVLGFVNEII